jgi:hypothetical protein
MSIRDLISPGILSDEKENTDEHAVGLAKKIIA